MQSMKYKSVEHEIRKRIYIKEWKANEKISSSRTFAVEYSCSINTVEKALKEIEASGLIVRKERQGSFIKEHVIEKEFKGLVAASVIGIDNPLWIAALRGVEDYLHQFGFSMISISHEQSIEKLEASLNNLIHIGIDGVILSPVDHTLHERKAFYKIIQNLQNENIEVVFIDRFRHDLSVPYITSDNTSASYRLTKHLIENGHNKIGMIRTTGVNTIMDRLEGFRQACFEMEVPFFPEVMDIYIPTIAEDFVMETEEFRFRLKEKLEQHQFTALFATNDQIANETIRLLDEMGLRIPEDISLISYDVDNLHRTTSCTLTGARQNFYGMGKLAAESMVNMLHSENIAHEIPLGQTFPSAIVYGTSVKNLLHKGG